MKQLCFLIILLSWTTNLIGAPVGRAGRNVVNKTGGYTSTSRNTTQGKMIVAPTQAQQNTAAATQPIATPDSQQIDDKTPDPELEQIKTYRNICLSNNIGVGNTFVWAARNSNISNYMYMTEDLEDPKNNTCFVRVDVNSTDPRIDVSDINGKYFEMGKNIVCGSWVDEQMMEKRILDAKKGARAWATVAGAVGGAAVGVGSMELFGNKLIGGKVMGQKALEGQDLLRSQILTLKEKNKSEYDRIIKALDNLESVCGDTTLWAGDNTQMPQDCNPATNPFIGLRKTLK